MSHVSPSRIVAIAGLVTAVALTSGCGWFRNKSNDSYKLSGEARPLELPPEFSRPDTSGAMMLPGQSSALASQAGRPGASQPTAGFVVPGNRDEVFARIGQVLQSVNGLQIANSAQLLGSYDVTHQSSNFLVRAVQTGETVYVSTIDPRGIPETGPGATAVLEALKQAFGAQ